MIDVETFLQQYMSDIAPETRRLAEAFLSDAGEGRRYLFGRTEQATNIAEKLDVTGFIDDFASATQWMGKPVLSSHAVPKDALVVNCVLNAKPATADARIREMGFHNVLKFSDVRRQSGGVIELPDFCKDMEQDIRSNSGEWQELYVALSDEASRVVLDDLVKFRLTCDYDYLRSYSFRPNDQYFESFMQYAGEVFVDAGGFDGQTSWEFCKRYPDYRAVYLFEPVPASMALARDKLAGLRDIHFIAKGVSDTAASLTFDSASGSANSVVEGGDLVIDVIPIDEALSSPPSFIKMDLEGWEAKALAGARRHIAAARPKLAIAVYHRTEDFRELFRYVKSLHPDYQVYLRHYTEGWSESVMFFR